MGTHVAVRRPHEHVDRVKDIAGEHEVVVTTLVADGVDDVGGADALDAVVGVAQPQEQLEEGREVVHVDALVVAQKAHVVDQHEGPVRNLAVGRLEALQKLGYDIKFDQPILEFV